MFLYFDTFVAFSLRYYSFLRGHTQCALLSFAQLMDRCSWPRLNDPSGSWPFGRPKRRVLQLYPTTQSVEGGKDVGLQSFSPIAARCFFFALRVEIKDRPSQWHGMCERLWTRATRSASKWPSGFRQREKNKRHPAASETASRTNAANERKRSRLQCPLITSMCLNTRARSEVCRPNLFHFATNKALNEAMAYRWFPLIIDSIFFKDSFSILVLTLAFRNQGTSHFFVYWRDTHKESWYW